MGKRVRTNAKGLLLLRLNSRIMKCTLLYKQLNVKIFVKGNTKPPSSTSGNNSSMQGSEALGAIQLVDTARKAITEIR